VKIIFTPAFEEAEIYYKPVEPSVKSVPEWYKKMPLTWDGNTPTLSDNGLTNFTVKACSPFLDALTTGYTIILPSDVQVSKTEQGDIEFRWATPINDYISRHPEIQTPGVSFNNTSKGGAFKWRSGWTITTPKGYSTLFTHPLNRHDLPFTTLSGVVETDEYKMPTEFPFLFNDLGKTPLPYVIKAGTPIVQLVPFKRENWTSETQEYSEREAKKNFAELSSTMFRSYKQKYWKPKRYQ
jgi:hypothetical protein